MNVLKCSPKRGAVSHLVTGTFSTSWIGPSRVSPELPKGQRLHAAPPANKGPDVVGSLAVYDTGGNRALEVHLSVREARELAKTLTRFADSYDPPVFDAKEARTLSAELARMADAVDPDGKTP